MVARLFKNLYSELKIMRKIYLLSVWAMFLGTDAIGQTIIDRIDFGYPNSVAISIPKEFTYGNAPLITMYDNTDNQNLLVYDENLDLIKSINIKNDKTFDYQLTYQDEIREVQSVTEYDKTSFEYYESYKDFVQRLKMTDPSFEESQLNVVKQENGDSIITSDYTYSQWNTNEQMYLGYDYFGMKYPKVYWVCSKDVVTGYRTSYRVTYTDWHITGTHVENHQTKLNRIRLSNINLNQGDGRANYYFEASQTLFNDDEDFEYIIPKYKLSSTGNLSNNNPSVIFPTDEETIVTSRSTIISKEKELSLSGFQIVSANGNIIKDMTFDNDFEGSIELDYTYVITIGQTTYLAFNGQSNHKSSTIFYKIDRSTNSIRQVMKAPATMTLSPKIVPKNTTININFSDGNEKGSEIVIRSASGMTISKLSVPKEQTSVQMAVTATTGLYCVSRIQKSKVVNTQKIIVK